MLAGLPPAVNSPVPSTVRVEYLAQKHNTLSLAKILNLQAEAGCYRCQEINVEVV